MLKPSEEQGVAVSEASESLLEDIKKLNAQQRPDVPLCFIYAPISHIPMAVNTRARLICIFLLSILSRCRVTARSSLTSYMLWTRPRLSGPTVALAVCSFSSPLNRIPTIPNYGWGQPRRNRRVVREVALAYDRFDHMHLFRFGAGKRRQVETDSPARAWYPIPQPPPPQKKKTVIKNPHGDIHRDTHERTLIKSITHLG